MKDTFSLLPTADQTFEIVGTGGYDFAKTLARSRQLQQQGDLEEACNERYQAFQRIAELLPEDEDILLEWNDPNTRAALEILHGSAIDHFLAGDFEMAAAMLELLGEVDPEDHLEAVPLLAFNYLALEEYELFDEVMDDISDKSTGKELLRLWSSFRREGRLPEEEVARLKSRPWFAEFVADEHPIDEAYLRDIESERPSAAAQARELWLQTEHLWAVFPEFIETVKKAYFSTESTNL